jgi:hypothetical protein
VINASLLIGKSVLFAASTLITPSQAISSGVIQLYDSSHNFEVDQVSLLYMLCMFCMCVAVDLIALIIDLFHAFVCVCSR